MTTYAALTTRVKDEAGINPSDTKFDAQWPAMLLDAELRIYREIDPLVARKYQKTDFPADAADRPTLPQPDGCLIMRALDYFTPSGTMTKRNPIERRTEGFIKDYWPDRSLTGAPKYFCELGHNLILIAPTADNTYTVEMAFTVRRNSLSIDTAGTYISQTYPDLLFFSAMVKVAGFKKNYGLMSDDQQQGVTWENEYTKQRDAARLEEGRRKRGSYADESQSEPPERNAVQ